VASVLSVTLLVKLALEAQQPNAKPAILTLTDSSILQLTNASIVIPAVRHVMDSDSLIVQVANPIGILLTMVLATLPVISLYISRERQDPLLYCHTDVFLRVPHPNTFIGMAHAPYSVTGH